MKAYVLLEKDCFDGGFMDPQAVFLIREKAEAAVKSGDGLYVLFECDVQDAPGDDADG